jgi:hypothetical protein
MSSTDWLSIRREDAPSKVVMACRAIIAFGIPTLTQTKLSWYLTRFRTISRSDWNLAERFVATRLIGSHVAQVNPADRFLEVAAD